MRSREKRMDNPALAHLAGAYFHLDWAEEFDNEWTAVDAFAKGSADLAPGLPREVDQLLTDCPTDADVSAYLCSIGSALTGPEDGGSAREWLRAIARRVEDSLANDRR
jgi:hypothetical protein